MSLYNRKLLYTYTKYIKMNYNKKLKFIKFSSLSIVVHR